LKQSFAYSFVRFSNVVGPLEELPNMIRLNKHFKDLNEMGN